MERNKLYYERLSTCVVWKKDNIAVKDELWNNTTMENRLKVDAGENNTTMEDRLLSELNLVYDTMHTLSFLVILVLICVRHNSYLIIQDPMRHLRSPNKLVIYYLRT